MALARDGSHGVLTATWRRVEVEGVLHVEETIGGVPGATLWGPIPDIATCTGLIRDRAAFVKARLEEHAAMLREKIPSIQVGKPPKILGDDHDQDAD